MKGKERILMTEWPEMLNFVFEKSVTMFAFQSES